ncbi:hypothetical protein BFZC1_23494 [Lysinibacillus fusiformis ZC1]|nr:hypothetical protein BFZC1_23494 [Lysinibacillus fusiformis ZC1]
MIQESILERCNLQDTILDGLTSELADQLHPFHLQFHKK